MQVYQSEVLKRKKEKKNSEYRTQSHANLCGYYCCRNKFLNESYFQEENICVENYVLTTNCMS